MAPHQKLPDQLPEDTPSKWNNAMFGAMRAMVSWDLWGSRATHNPYLEDIRVENLSKYSGKSNIIFAVTKLLVVMVV